MTRRIAVLRPEPGNRVTAAAVEGQGRPVLRLPLFAVQPVDWAPPDPALHDAVLFTSANALRHGGRALASLTALPAYAVGAATAEAARRHGFAVQRVGTADAAALIAEAQADGVRRALHLAGRERKSAVGGIIAAIATVYASEAVDVAPEQVAALSGGVAMVHSPRAGARLAELVAMADRGSIGVAAISQAALDACGGGWAASVRATAPSDDALIDAALALAD